MVQQQLVLKEKPILKSIAIQTEQNGSSQQQQTKSSMSLNKRKEPNIMKAGVKKS